MKAYNLTKAHIQRINDVFKNTIEISLLNIKDLEDYPFLLIIQSIIENSIKLSIYPLKKDKIIKLTFSGFNFSIDTFDEISKTLKNIQIIHTSGVLLIAKQLFYECYLNLSLAEIEAMELKKTLEKIKNIFKEIKIEEIALEKIKEN
ncbi:MAG: hypothetical protein JSV23_09290 [Promethearchaeota archaeon]|nr:MAG: hypothetical protein JSV23_09290 [Candidatus Lokiarchaeota archaeon]